MMSHVINAEENVSLQPSTRSSTPVRTGEILVKEGLINEDDIKRVLAIQRQGKASPLSNSNRLFGMILCDLNLITPIEIYCILQQYGKLLSMDEMLVRGCQVSSETLTLSRQESRASDTPFFTFLLNQGLVTVVELQKLLYSLYRIPYRTIQDFRLDPGRAEDLTTIIEKRLALKNRMIPLVRQEKVALIGITEPDALLAIKNISVKFPLLRFKAVFIPFSGFKTLFNLLYADKDEQEFEQRSPDISLLLNFKTTIVDPENEQDKVLSLYRRYETVKALTCDSRSNTTRSRLFHEFIVEEHKRVKTRYSVDRVEYLLRKKGRDLFIIAVPKGFK